ncbi:hypothetical protein GE09DRAFT_378442 [Coniochaeta sp. 2T2.1]|nr:hypothetical protein GE09DRAFT_378442 [Coniochaeta sp. 2T2.1]
MKMFLGQLYHVLSPAPGRTTMASECDAWLEARHGIVNIPGLSACTVLALASRQETSSQCPDQTQSRWSSDLGYTDSSVAHSRLASFSERLDGFEMRIMERRRKEAGCGWFESWSRRSLKLVDGGPSQIFIDVSHDGPARSMRHAIDAPHPFWPKVNVRHKQKEASLKGDPCLNVGQSRGALLRRPLQVFRRLLEIAARVECCNGTSMCHTK